MQLHRRALGLVVILITGSALATGADENWTRCPAPARLAPDPGGRTFYVSTTGTDVSSCAVGWTFRTIDAAVKCALGKDTIFVHGGTYGPFKITNFYPSDWVLITNVSGETPVIDGRGANGTGPMTQDWESIVYLQDVSKLAIQGLEIKNTGVPGTFKGGVGLKADSVTFIKLYYNSIHDTARHSILLDGHQLEVVGNDVYNAVMRNQNNQIYSACDHTGSDSSRPCYWDGAIGTGNKRSLYGLTFRGNKIHESWGECLNVGPADGTTAEGNRIYNCLSVGIYVSNSRNVTVNRNWVLAANDTFNRPDSNTRADGVYLTNESDTLGWSDLNVNITNNILEWVNNGVRYWNSGRSGGVPETYGDVYIGFNDINRTRRSPIKFDAPKAPATAPSKVAGNLVLNTQSGLSWLDGSSDPAFGSNWTSSGNYNYTVVTTTDPGIVDTYGTYIPAYDWRSDANVRYAIRPNSQPEMPATDYHCAPRSQGSSNAPGAVN